MGDPPKNSQAGWGARGRRGTARIVRQLLRIKSDPPPSSAATEVMEMLRLTATGTSAPNINELWRLTKDMEAMKLTVKFFGYELAKALLASLPPLPPGGPFPMALTSRPSTQADLEANWSRYWSAQIQEPHTIHRRVWEHAFVLQVLAQSGKLRPGMKGLAFDPGGPLPAYLAAKGCTITAVGKEPPSADMLFRGALLDRATFDQNVKVLTADTGALPHDLGGFDYCWSIGSLQHAGSIAKAFAFLDATADTLKPGGVAVHTTEFNFANDHETIDNWGTVLFQRQHFEQMAERLGRKGCKVLPLDFNVGSQPLDRFIDVPPFEMSGLNVKDWSRDTMHIKVNIDGFPCTSFGIIVARNS